jgi:hypothetical protein
MILPDTAVVKRRAGKTGREIALTPGIPGRSATLRRTAATTFLA